MKRLILFLVVGIFVIAGIATVPVSAAGPGVYLVRPGDTLTKIAARHGVTVRQLAAANGLRMNSWVYIGQRLTIPAPQLAPGAPRPIPAFLPGGL